MSGKEGSSSGSQSGRPDGHRRKWGRSREDEGGRKREMDGFDWDWEDDDIVTKDEAGAPPVKKTLLKRRDYDVDLDSKLGKSTVISKNSPADASAGYYCNVCDCVVKDSINFLDHINGKKHQRNLGMSMKIERSSLDQVKSRFTMNKKKMEEKRKEYSINERVQELKEEEEKVKEYKKNRQRRKRGIEETSSSALEDDSEMKKMMGFSGFGSSKKS
ncbi:zinc finger matrin-type protein 2 [Lepeophtheirus salmonis]|uniref:Zinc finger matrintype protein 2like [Bombyx mori] n=1 Tax=Lepeophtheirus salmonis TaxID=72036 RepID=A0A0K2TC34_LEPSM|nr:zinc finger matrin-type protein 2-like [Lepeophtheirus salmonis]